MPRPFTQTADSSRVRPWYPESRHVTEPPVTHAASVPNQCTCAARILVCCLNSGVHFKYVVYTGPHHSLTHAENNAAVSRSLQTHQAEIKE